MTQEQIENINSSFEANDFEKVVAIANKLENPQADNALLSKLALAYFHTDNYDKSTSIFEHICQTSEESVDWFNLATSAIMNNDTLKGLQALETAIRYNKETKTNGEGIPTPFMYLYAAYALKDSEKFDFAFEQLNKLGEIYKTLSITDDTFLYMRGVPFFSEFVSLAKAILPNQKVIDPASWVKQISSSMDENGRDILHQLI